MTGSVIRLSSFHYVVIDYVPAAQPEYKVLYIVFYLRSCKNKNINDFWWLLKHFRHSWYENNCSFASLIFFSVSVSHRRGPNSSWTLVFWYAHWFAPWAEYSLKTWGWYSTCLSDCQIQQRVSPCTALLLLLFITMSTIGHQPSYSQICFLLPKVTCTAFNVLSVHAFTENRTHDLSVWATYAI